MTVARKEGLLKMFKLTTTIATTNMHLFDEYGVIKKYATPEQSKKRSKLLLLVFFLLHKLILKFYVPTCLQSLKSSSNSGFNTTRRERLENHDQVFS